MLISTGFPDGAEPDELLAAAEPLAAGTPVVGVPPLLEPELLHATSETLRRPVATAAPHFLTITASPFRAVRESGSLVG
jgi:hypothetical protein